MKNLLFILLLFLTRTMYSAGSIEVTFTNQADFDSYNFISSQPYWVHLENDTTLPVTDQINNLLPVSNVDTMLLDIQHTLISDLSDLQGTSILSLYLKGNKNFDTLYIPDIIISFSLNCDQTFLQYVYGGHNVEEGGDFVLNDNDRLKKVDFELEKLKNLNTTFVVKLLVQQNDSLKTLIWNNDHHVLGNIDFFENRQLKHVHLETVREFVSPFPLTQGGFRFNIVLDSISGCTGLDSVFSLNFKQNYMLENACVFQKGISNYLNSHPDHESFYFVGNNGFNLQSLDDLLNEDCSWLPNGVAELPHQELTLYPNPAHNEVFVEMPDKTTPYQIYDMSGKVVKQGNIATNGRIGLSAISGGMYILQVGDKRSKLVIQ